MIGHYGIKYEKRSFNLININRFSEGELMKRVWEMDEEWRERVGVEWGGCLQIDRI